jgi:hypothetical protein
MDGVEVRVTGSRTRMATKDLNASCEALQEPLPNH